jgi:hypothetical protein
MSRGLLFWIIMILLLLSALWSYWPTGGLGVGYLSLGFPIILWVLLALLGWKVFGPILRD